MIGPRQTGISFRSDGFRLLGTLFLARAPHPRPTAVLLHGIPGIEKNYDLARALLDAGWNSLIFHYRGCWGSHGSYRLETIPLDIAAAIETLDSGGYSEIDRERLYLVGHSLGGWAAVLAAAVDTRIQGVAVYGAIADPRDFSFSRSSIAEDFIPYLHGTNTHSFASEWQDLSRDFVPVEQVARISPRPILIVHSLADEIVPYSQSQRLFDYAQEPKSFLSHPDSDHSFTRHRTWLIRRIIGWLEDLTS